ncbi:XRE family transcriptional regulator [Streptomyces cyaneochromogenes]|uniref:XRE family transcriptional regulator n=1 Tax=Streptomyces cyaneochromogenes TaxID=2496836 RepID=A0A3S9MCK2_9ACTN|nr:helix-turn-helix transcriptional regulator [Streptomyces cyaneochromogenes]AZQ36902.1 XRE family transcriptional regulator [Streptomyces cyaneochromogenes]
MSSWQPLPDELPPEVRHFVEQLRQLKDRTGLSLASLGARTAYSKSSWQRYLNATQPPPRQAVVALCRVAAIGKEEAERFGVRWELAVQAWPKPVTAQPESEPESEPAEGADEYEDDPTLPWWDAPPKSAEPPSRRLLVVAVVLVVALALTALIGAVALG